MPVEKLFWIMRDYVKCSGCRRCEIVCSLHREGKIWPEASTPSTRSSRRSADLPLFYRDFSAQFLLHEGFQPVVDPGQDVFSGEVGHPEVAEGVFVSVV